MRFIALSIAFLSFFPFHASLRAESDDPAKQCAAATEGSDLALAISHCTAVIESGQLSDRELADALNERGLIHHRNRDYDAAIRDYNRTLTLQPKFGRALVRRAQAYQEKRDYERSLADYEAAIQMDPKLVFERPKGFLLFYLGRMTQSAETFENYMKSNPGDVWVILLRYLVEAKIGSALAAARDLEVDAGRLNSRDWPSPIIHFHLGKIGEKALFAAANDPDPKIKNEKTCAVNFHAGEARLLRAHISGAVPLLRAAEKDCPSHFHESHGASTELKRLGLK